MTMDDTQIEVIARSMYEADQVSWKNTDNTQSQPDVRWEDMRDETEHIPYEGISLGRNHYRDMAHAAVAAMEGEVVDTLVDIDAFASEFGDQLNDRMGFGWHLDSIGTQMQLRTAIKMALRYAITDAMSKKKGGVTP